MRTLLTVFVLLLDDIAIVLIVFFIVWKLELSLPLWAIIALIVGLVALSAIAYRIVAPVLNKRSVTGAEAMIGLEGRVVTPLAPEGTIKVCGELWQALATDAAIDADEEVLVMGMEGLKLLVRRK
ncbi:MAG: NfeD family protein [Chloroflexota bacterium]|nr:NfeD family protein [Chloroflexota bacterium]